MAKENLVEAILEQKRKREAPLPTKQDFVEQAINELKALLPKKPMLASKKNESKEQVNARDKMLKKILTTADKMSPEKNHEFIVHIPDMHLSWIAMGIICQNSSLLDLYADIISAIYKSDSMHTAEQERIWLAMDNENLIHRLSSGGMEWSRGSKRMIEKQYPTVYKHFFAYQHPLGFFD